MDITTQLAHSQEVSKKVALLLQKRVKLAQEGYKERVQKALSAAAADAMQRPLTPLEAMTGWYNYSVDFAQRSVLFWDTLRQRGNNFNQSTKEGLLPVLHFEYEMVQDGRSFERPVNYAVVRIVPPEGVTIDPQRRPYVIIDPRAGHGPGIGGFKDDSQVGVALRAGHPVYFVIFFRDPQPGQTLPDVCAAESQFIRKVRSLHPDSEKPAIIGNCQGGWAAMMLAAAGPDDTGPIVINGAPMSYWGGAWQEGANDNPMRYSGGMLGGTWLSSLVSDLGDGVFDGAYLVENFEKLNPANTFWDKYYHLYANVDTEPPRFLEFERWWGGFYLMNREEIEWIVQNLFVGNKLWSDTAGANGKVFDLREIRSPIVLFASMGDNITPPQQAFNWVADVYGSTEEIKSRGQVIVGLLHQDIGHLGIFVSGKVAKKEHAQIVSVLKTIELLPPGVYGMALSERKGASGATEYEVEFREHQLEEIVARLNRLGRADEKPFRAVAAVSDFNQRAYELFARPLVQAMSNEASAQALRELHPLRMQNWAISNLNPWLSWLAPAADAVRGNRQAMDESHPLRKGEKAGAEMLSATLDYHRALRDAATEAGFFTVYANLFALSDGDKSSPQPERAAGREGPEGREALARVAYLLTRSDEPLPLSRLEMRQELLADYAEYLPDMPLHEWRRVRGTQEVIVRHEPDQALASLPTLLAEPNARARLLGLIDKLMADRRVIGRSPTSAQTTMAAHIRSLFREKAPRRQPTLVRARA